MMSGKPGSDRASDDGGAVSREGFGEAGWELLTLDEAGEGSLPPVDVGFALAHPYLGIALVDLLRPRAGDSVHHLRTRLEAAGFPQHFPGYLPIVHRVLEVREMWRLSQALGPAFLSEPPLGVREGWIELVQRALLLKEGEVPDPRSEAPHLDREDMDRLSVPARMEALAPFREEGEASAIPAASPIFEPQPQPPPEVRQEEEVAPGPALEPLPLQQEPILAPRRARPGLWFAVAAALLAAIGLSHHLVLPDGLAARLHLGTSSTSP
nr:hypothetical protein [uncultured Roseococcus sp.]